VGISSGDGETVGNTLSFETIIVGPRDTFPAKKERGSEKKGPHGVPKRIKKNEMHRRRKQNRETSVHPKVS